jgi:starch phosphorylase
MKNRELRTLPDGLQSLHDLARNLRWAWHAPARRLFETLDPEQWRATSHNPVRLLAELPADRLVAAAGDRAYLADVAAAAADLEAYLAAEDTWFRRVHGDEELRVAYFSAEFGIAESLRVYAGGLGVLAGDHLKSASDLGVPLVGIGLFYREGYFAQQVDGHGAQHETYPQAVLDALPIEPALDASDEQLYVRFTLAGREAVARVWHVRVGRIPLYLLDTDVSENRPEHRRITDRLYGGDIEHRLAQEIVLGIGGHRVIEALGMRDAVLHLNEGHAAFAALERARLEHAAQTALQRRTAPGPATFRDAFARAARNIVFTSHTPVEAGHDYFPPHLLERELGSYLWQAGVPWSEFVAVGRRDRTDEKELFCMTVLALRGSTRRNGVSELHGDITRRMWHSVWPDAAVDAVPIGHITNGVHLATWVAPQIADLLDQHVGSWRTDPNGTDWARLNDVPDETLWAARSAQRRELIDRIRARRATATEGARAFLQDDGLDPDALTIVFARRFATYKRATLLLHELDRLSGLLAAPHPVQFVFAGKAHPRDEPGKALLREIQQFAAHETAHGRFVFLEGYDLALARTLVQAADVWLNVPIRPYEASGTSGMKAAANGSLNLSIADGWWEEAWRSHNRLDAPIGWAIVTSDLDNDERDAAEADTLYTLLEDEVVPLFYQRDDAGIPRGWLQRVRAALSQVPPFFNTHRMVRDYVESAYLQDINGTGVQSRASSASAR